MDMQPPDRNLSKLVQLLTQYRYVLGSESAFQEGLAQVLRAQGIAHLKEHDLGRDFGRIDFYLPESQTGIELKVKGSPSEVVRQIHRYALCPDIAALVLLTGKRRLTRMPASINGKPLVAASLWWGQV